ncbi:MAG TPA: hypothetical protein VNR70_13130 [Steroidobacteraceae bacterium]|nr:hypothetical protein [Steroidobacteraceae bacterium]
MAKMSLPGRLLVLVIVVTALSNNAQALELATYKVVDLAYGVSVSSQKNPALLVLADRKMDDSYAEQNSVTFKVYTLKQAFHDEFDIGDCRDRAN